MNDKKTTADFEELYRQELEELNLPYSEEEIELHLHHRQWKSVLEMIHAHNWKLIILCREWNDYLAGRIKTRPVKKICKYVNPSQSSDINNACRLIREFINLMCEYGEGSCPQARINTYTSRSTATLIDQLDQLRHSKYLTRAECASSNLFRYATYRGEPTMSPEKFRATLESLADAFVKNCTANAEELADFTAQNVKAIEGDAAARIYRKNCRPISRDEAKALLNEQTECLQTTIRSSAKSTRRVVLNKLDGEDERLLRKRGVSTNVRREQVKAVKAKLIEMANQGVKMSLHAACVAVWKNLKGGYPSARALYNYCHDHKEDFPFTD